MAEHVQIRALEHLRGSEDRPHLVVAVETRDRPGPAFKAGLFSEDVVWIQLRGGLLVGKARVRESWRGEYSRLDEIRSRATAARLPDDFWSGRPRHGYAIVALLDQERWVEPLWAGPRTYGYEWIVLEDDRKRRSWLGEKPPPRGGEGLKERFVTERGAGFTR